MPSLFAFLHFAAAFALFAALAAELTLTRNVFDATTARRLLIVDRMFGICAAIVLIAGLARVLWYEKGPSYYFHSAPFMAKLTLFVLIGLLSIYPTMQFLSWRAPLKRGETPEVSPEKLRRIRRVLHTEATLFVLLLLCASLMAHGVGVVGA